MSTRNDWNIDPWRELRALENVMDSIFTRRSVGMAIERYPAVNLYADGEDAVARIEVPGLGPEDIDISVKGRAITIKGERKEPEITEGDIRHRRERNYGRFARTIALPYPIESDKVAASCKNGVLTIRLPRQEADKPRRIEITNN